MFRQWLLLAVLLGLRSLSGAQLVSAREAGPFAYDSSVPLDFHEISIERVPGASIHDISYASARGGPVPAYLVLPDGKGPFAAIEFIHWGQGDRTEFLSEALSYAKAGAVSLLIDAPFNRPGYKQAQFMIDPEGERDMYVQLVVDARRGFDLLLARSDVDPKRLAFVGHSLGATWGGVLAGVDKRPKTFVLMGGLPNLTDFSGADSFSQEVRQKYPAEQIKKYTEVLGAINPENFAGRAAPARLYFQFAQWDRYISHSSAERYEKVASQPKTARTYETSHEFNDVQSRCDRTGWLRKELLLRDVPGRAGCGPAAGRE